MKLERSAGRLLAGMAGGSAGFGLVNLRWTHAVPVAGLGELQWLVRVDNAANRVHVGSVIVNDANGRFFEPGAPRAWLTSARWVSRW